MRAPSEDSMKIAQEAADVFGGESSVSYFRLPNRGSEVDVLCAVDSPSLGRDSYATVNVSESPLMREGQDVGLRVEFVSTCLREYSGWFGKAMAAAGYCVIHDQSFAASGRVFLDVISGTWDEAVSTRHFLFVSPFVWGDAMPSTMHLESKTVAWLHGLPVTDAEVEYLKEFGCGALEERLETSGVDIADLNRRCVVSS